MSETNFSMHASWYVVHTKPKQEFRAVEHLQNQGYNCFLPTLQVDKISRGKVDTRVEPLFARYLFIQLNSTTSNWMPIRSTRGVSNLVAFGGQFATLPNALVEALQAAPHTMHQPLFESGETVEIASGPFAGLKGIYQMSDGEARAMVLIEMMSQPQKLMFAVEVLRKAA